MIIHILSRLQDSWETHKTTKADEIIYDGKEVITSARRY